MEPDLEHPAFHNNLNAAIALERHSRGHFVPRSTVKEEELQMQTGHSVSAMSPFTEDQGGATATSTGVLLER